MYLIQKNSLKQFNISKFKIILVIALIAISSAFTSIKIESLINNDSINIFKDTVYVEVENYEHLKYSYLFNNLKVKNREAFIYEVKAMSLRLGIPYKHILFVFNSESGLNPKAKNKSNGAYGLFQIIPTTAKGLGINQEELNNSDGYKQLEYFEKYINYYGVSKIKTIGDLYTLVYLPAYLNNDNKVIPIDIRNANPAYKHCSTIGEFKLLIEKKFNKQK